MSLNSGITNREINTEALIMGWKLGFDPLLNDDVHGTPSFVDATSPTAAELGVPVLKSGMPYFRQSTGVLYIYDGSAWTNIVSSGASLDGAYNAGSAITVDTAAISMTNAHATIDTMTITNSHATGAGDGLQVTMSGAGIQTGHGINIDVTSTTASGNGVDINCSVAGITGHCLNLAHSGTGKLINSTNFTVTPAGAVVCVGVNAGNAAIVTTGTLGAAATTLTGLLTVSAGGAAITGNSTVTGDLAVTGALSFGGALTIGDTLTVDELIFDTDGVAPAGTNCYAVRDNSGDLTLNAITGKQVLVAINNTDEYGFGASAIDLNSNHLDNSGYLIMNAVTLPAVTEVYIGHDNVGDCTINALTGKEVCLAVNGVDIVQVGTELELVSGVNLQFLGDDNIVDSAGNELVTFSATGSAVNGLQVKNAATGARPKIGSNGASAEANIGLDLLDSNGNELIELIAVASATNGLKITNAATANPVMIGADGTGATADRGIRFNDSNGNEELVLVSTASAVNEIGIVNTATGVKPIIRAQGEGDLGMVFASFDGTNTEEILILTATAAAVNEITITSTATGVSPLIEASGETNLHLRLAGKGTGGISVSDDYVHGSLAAHTADTADGSLYLSSTAHATKGFVCIPNGDLGLIVGSDGSVDRAGTVGTNAIHIFNGTAPVGALVNGVSIYSAAGELYTMDATGNALLNSPHSNDGDVILHSFSPKKNKTIRIHLEKLLRKLLAGDPSLGQYFEEEAGLKHNKEW